MLVLAAGSAASAQGQAVAPAVVAPPNVIAEVRAAIAANDFASGVVPFVLR
jgi:hypothetical protein